MKHVKLPTVELLLSSLLFVTSVPGGGGAGYFQKNWVGVSGTLPKIFTKICHFPCSVSDLVKNLIPYFRPALQSVPSVTSKSLRSMKGVTVVTQ